MDNSSGLTDASAGGLALARIIGEIYSRNDNVKVIMAGGSVSKGCADQYSDLEIGVFWSEPPTQAERKEAVSQLGGQLWTMDRGGATMEHFGLYEATVDGVLYTGRAMISMNHATVQTTEIWLADVVERCNVSEEKQELLSAIQQGIWLAGDADLLQTWQAKAAAYPTGLAVKIIRENLSFGPWFLPEAYALRGDQLILHSHFLVMSQHLLRVLMALNRTYQPSSEYKWAYRVLPALPLKPQDAPHRLREVFQTGDLSDAWKQMKTLLYETLDLLERHLPELQNPADDGMDMESARKRWAVCDPYTLMPRITAGLPQ